VDSPVYFVVLGLLCGLVGFRLGWRSGQRITLPLIQGALGWVGFATAWRAGGAFAGVDAVLGWVAGTTMISLGRFRREPEAVDRIVLRAVPYRVTMFEWLRTGRGPETRPFRTALEHTRELILYLIAAVSSANLLSIAMGAVLLNYMNAYVARLSQLARRRWVVRLLAWNVWSILRVAAYVLLGVAAATPLAERAGFPANPEQIKLLWVAGLTGAALDLALKLSLSRICGRQLASAVELSEPRREGTER
jgi:hypothetical protein